MISGFAVKHWQFTLVLFLSLVALGLHALVSIPKNEDPTFPVPNFLVIAVLPGGTPADIEHLIVDPVEASLKSLEDVKAIKSEMSEGLAVIRLEFDARVDPERKRDEVLREVSAVRPNLPAELSRLEVRQINSADVNIVEFALVSNRASYRKLDDLARALKRKLENIRGVRAVGITGSPGTEVRVALQPSKLVALSVSPVEVGAAISADSASIPAGAVEASARQFSVKTTGEYASVDEIRDTIVRSGEGRALRVRDLADVSLTDAEPKQLARFDGKRALLIAVSQQENRDIFQVRSAIERVIDAFARTLPPEVALVRGFDQATNVAERLHSFARDFGVAVLLVLLTLLPLGFRASLVVLVSIPLSLAFGLLLLWATGFTLNQLSMVGFVIALGLLVDDSVVVIENVTRHLRMGGHPREVAVNATREITASVLGCTATLVFAFLPLLALPGTAGQFIRSLPVALVCTIVASLFVSLSIVPFLSSIVLKPTEEHGNFFLRATRGAIDRLYSPVLVLALRHPLVTTLVAAALLVWSISLVPRIGFSLFPKAGIPQFMVHIETADGASLGETDRAARFVEGVLARHPEVRNVSTTIGRDHSQVFYNVVPKNEKANIADVLAEIDTQDAEARTALYATLRKDLANYPGAMIELEEFAAGPPLEAPIVLRIVGEARDALERLASKVKREVESTPGTRDVRSSSTSRRTDLRAQIDREKAAALGVRLSDVERAVRLAVSGVVAGKYREDLAEQAFDIRLTLPSARQPGQTRPGLQVLEQLQVPNQRGSFVPLSLIANLAFAPSPSAIRHYDRERCVNVTSHVRDGFNTNRVTKAVLARLAEMPLPSGVRIVTGGELESGKESFAGVGVAILAATFGILAILVLEFGTFRSTLIVASVIPLGVVGGLLALFLSGYTLSFTATIGFVALMGIEIKNSILLVDFTNQLREEGVELDEAIRRAGEIRFLPILLTSLTAIGGLIPLILERSSLYSPLAIVILGGLVSSTVLSRVVTPVLYKLFAPPIKPVRSSEHKQASLPLGAVS